MKASIVFDLIKPSLRRELKSFIFFIRALKQPKKFQRAIIILNHNFYYQRKFKESVAKKKKSFNDLGSGISATYYKLKTLYTLYISYTLNA